MRASGLLLLVSLLLFGCAEKVDLPQITVAARDSAEFTRFRTELGSQFPADRLRDFDVAVQELKLDAMARDIKTAAEREADMVKVAQGKTVADVTLLGWQARRARFQREIDFLNNLLQPDLEIQQRTAATGTPAAVTARIRSSQEVIAKLQRDLQETERRLAELTAN